PISLARSVLQETKRELQRMEEQQEMKNSMLEKLVTETANQLNEQVRSWGASSLGDMAEKTGSMQEELEEAKADCSSCTFNIKVLVGKLLQRCEKLQEQVDALESRQMAPDSLCSAPHALLSLEQDQELMQNMETKIIQIQGDCEKLSFVSGSLQKDSQQKQKEIEVCGCNCCGVGA
ncbi:QRIC2 protein, partial [Climacteris rufus]|nr:QRIC2 protein [Climacteris rufus]